LDIRPDYPEPGTEGQVDAIVRRARDAPLKVLICCDSDIVLQVAGMALEAAGHQVVLDREPQRLVREAAAAQALLVDASRARQAPALLRDRGFTGRAILVADGAPEVLAREAADLKLDGAVPVTPPDEIARRLNAALGSRRRVLIVDDSEIVARLLQEDLEAKGFEIHYAPDAEKATSIILKRQTRPDLILLDINMPKVDGAQFCRFVKKNEMFRAIKVIFCSGEEKEKVKRLVVECGADGFISKDELLGKWIVENG
jgi:CheY-like chemotaxis protein